MFCCLIKYVFFVSEGEGIFVRMVRLLNVFVLVIAQVPPRLSKSFPPEFKENGACMTDMDVQEVC